MPRPLVFSILLAVPLALQSPACAGGEGGGGGSSPAAEDEASASGDLLVGSVTRAELETHQPDWVAATIEARPDPEAARALTAVAPGARVTVYVGTWCSDSKRELPRLWRGLDDAGVFAEEELPFTLEYLAVDRDKREPTGRAADLGIEYVPTFVVSRDGVEVGRVVEESTDGIERHLLALLSGEARGVISARTDLGGS